ncbi:hypothetical protein CERZMDRAFT_90048 [Cercospora zeae-maydis SCOH1-5]|uniref:Uncharacterized protein n=1 Tax=Cercospora zeae-maydis SCOH1-5 TaxID=717836 RepID=A0A6A6FRW4_9PEZI|nr:hypothetical protein CERZMDRAFT_90048 [Cercospora zeae-maydis SCOH1-5]
MADSQQTSRQSNAGEFMRGAGIVNDPEKKLWAPARWVAQLVQYLIALVMISEHLPFLSETQRKSDGSRSNRRSLQVNCEQQRSPKAETEASD